MKNLITEMTVGHTDAYKKSFYDFTSIILYMARIISYVTLCKIKLVLNLRKKVNTKITEFLQKT